LVVHNTYVISQTFPAWYLGRNPTKFVIHCAYGQDLAEDYGRSVRNIVIDPDYRDVFADVKMAEDSGSIRRFHTTHKGVYFAVGVGSAISGRGAHLLVGDDLVKDAAEADSEPTRRALQTWWRQVARTRLMPGGAIVLVGTRWREDDIYGWIIENDGKHRWEVIDLPAIANENDVLGRAPGEALWNDAEIGYPIAALNELKNDVGPRAWAALYQQSPVQEDGNIFKRPWFKIWDKPSPPACDYVIQSYDTAYGARMDAGDFSAIQTWGVFKHNGQHNAILLQALNERLSFPDLRRKAKDLYKKHNPDIVVIEAKASGQSLISELRRSGVLNIVPYNPDRDKTARAHAIAPLVESGCVWMPQDRFWAEDVINQATSFPNARHDDQVDAMTQALLRLKTGFFLRNPDDYAEEEPDEDAQRRRYYW
jgi:predicted phage terminase large subunit-like protein